jgi:hypothetical protein
MLTFNDVIFDPYYVNEIMCLNRPRAYPTHCLLCFKDVPTQSFSNFSYTHVKPTHKVRKTCSSKFLCISSLRYGHSKAIPIKHYGFSMGFVFDENTHEYSW